MARHPSDPDREWINPACTSLLSNGSYLGQLTVVARPEWPLVPIEPLPCSVSHHRSPKAPKTSTLMLPVFDTSVDDILVQRCRGGCKLAPTTGFISCRETPPQMTVTSEA